MSRLVSLSPEALNTCNRWQAITDPTQLTDELLISTQAMLRDLSTQEDQTTTITNLRSDVSAALDENIQATETIQRLRTRIATLEKVHTPRIAKTP